MAWRNLWRRPRRTLLGMAGIAFSCAFLIFMPSLQNGVYSDMIENSLRVFDGYAEIQEPGYREEPDIRDSFGGVDELLSELRDIGGLHAVSARASAYVLLSTAGRSFGARIVGVQPDTEPAVSTIPAKIGTGRFLEDTGSAEVVLGATLARNLHVDVGDSATLLGTGRDGSLAADSLTVVGIYETGIDEIDRLTAEMPLGRFQDTFAMPDQAHTIVLSGSRRSEVERLLVPIMTIARQHGLEVLDWKRLQPGVLQAILLDMSTALLIYAAMVVVVTFTLLNGLLMAVLERTSEFGVLMSLGMRPGRIGRMVWIETLLLLVLGLTLGLLLGYLVSAYFEHRGIAFGQAQEIYARFGLSGAMYTKVSALTLLAGPGVIALCILLAGIFPFWRVYRLEPVVAMRSV